MRVRSFYTRALGSAVRSEKVHGTVCHAADGGQSRADRNWKFESMAVTHTALFTRLASFLRNDRGNVGITFAVSALPLMAMVVGDEPL